MNELNSETLMKYAEKYGIKGRRTLSILGKNQQLINAMNSQIGLEFLRWLVSRKQKLKYRNQMRKQTSSFVQGLAGVSQSWRII